MNGSDLTDASAEASFSAAMDGHQEAIDNAVREVDHGSVASIHVGTARGGVPAAIIEVPLGDVTYRTHFEMYAWRRHPETDVAGLLRTRLGQALLTRDRFSHRLKDVHRKILPSLERNGGMRLVALKMDAASIEHRFDWFENVLIADVELLDSALRPRIESFHAFTAREFAGQFRMSGKDHARRHDRLAYLTANGAIFEMDQEVEDLVRRRGLDFGLFVAVMKDWREGEMTEARHGLRKELSGVDIRDGHIFLVSIKGTKSRRRFITEDEVGRLPH